MLSDCERRFVAHQRVAHLATADGCAVPHVMPVCFALVEHTLYITIDEKPKRISGLALKRLRNIAENPTVALVVDRYDEDWARLGWVMLRGRAEILSAGTKHEEAQMLLRSRYPQLGGMQIAKYPVFDSCRRLQRVTYEGRSKTARYREVSKPATGKTPGRLLFPSAAAAPIQKASGYRKNPKYGGLGLGRERGRRCAGLCRLV